MKLSASLTGIISRAVGTGFAVTDESNSVDSIDITALLMKISRFKFFPDTLSLIRCFICDIGNVIFG